MKEVIVMPKEARELIVRALKQYQHSLGQSMDAMRVHGGESIDVEPLKYEHFDTIGLIGIFNEKDAELEIRIDSDARNTFVSEHNVDFPLWDGVPF